MKKTLVTLAALAVSVASATTLDFKTATNGSTVDFTGADEIILTGATTITTTEASGVYTTTITSGDVTVTADAKRLFGRHGDNGNDDGTNRVLNGATIDFGTSGSLFVDQVGGVNLASMNLNLEAALTFVVTTDDATKLAAGYGVETRNLMSFSDAAWNNNMMLNSFTMGISTSDSGISLTDKTLVASNGDKLSYSHLTANESSLGQWAVYNADSKDISVAYVVKYVAASGGDGNVPEPATATLSLLALAGLAARRRRK